MNARLKNLPLIFADILLICSLAGCAASLPEAAPSVPPERPQTAASLPGASPAFPENADALYACKSAYVGDNSNTVGLLQNLAYGAALQKTELRTQAQPYGIIATYNFNRLGSVPEDYQQAWEENAAVVFALIGNADGISFNSGFNTYYTAYRADYEAKFGQDLRAFAQDEETFSAFVQTLAAQPGSAAEPSPARTPSSVTIGAGDPAMD